MQWKPRKARLIGVWLATFITMGQLLVAQLSTTQITDTIYHADGSPATGTVIVSWPAFTTASGESVPSGSTAVVLSANGTLSVPLVSNVGSDPVGTYYTAVYHLDDGTVTRQYWVVPVSTSPVKVSSIESTVLPTSVAMQTASRNYVDSAIAHAVATSGTSGSGTSGDYVLKTGDTMTGPLVLPGDPVSALQAADKNYVDTTLQQAVSGSSQKVSLVPTATQVVAQPVGTQLSVNNLNGEEYASQYESGNGSNGIANAIASTDCSQGCDIKVESNYPSTEPYQISSWKQKTHVEDNRGGGKIDNYLDPENASDPDTGQAINVVATRSAAEIKSLESNTIPASTALAIHHSALTGGSNLFPQTLEGDLPYFKSSYFALLLKGTYNTQGQHVLNAQSTDCYGIGDCLIGSRYITSSGGYRDEADEGAHPYDQITQEDSTVFQGTCTAGCATGSTSITISATQGAGTQGDGRYLIDKNPSKTISVGQLTGSASGIFPEALFSGTSFPVSVFFSTAALIRSQVNNVSPGEISVAIATTGVPAGFSTNTAAAPSSSGVACIADPQSVSPVPNFEMVNYSVVDGTHLQMTLNKVHPAGATIAIGGLCGYGLEQTVDTTNGLRQVFPVVGAFSSTALYYAGSGTAVIGVQNQTSGFLNVNASIASVTRSNNVVTVTTAGNLSADVNGLSLTIADVSDSSFNGTFTVTTTGPNTFTYSQTGANSSSSGGSASYLTGGYVLYPMAEVLGVMNPATKQVDGQMTLAPNTVAWSSGDAVEQPHYYMIKVGADIQLVKQYLPRPTINQQAGIEYDGNNGPGMTGWYVDNGTPASSYTGAGGTHTLPSYAYEARGPWQTDMSLDAGGQTVFDVGCNYRGCNRWDSAYNLFDLHSAVGDDLVHYDPNASTFQLTLRGQSYSFTPQSLSTQTINVGTLNASVINGSVNANSITSGSVSAARLPVMGASGSNHAAGIVPDPGAASGKTRYLREDGTWSTPTVESGGNLVAGATADYNFMEGTGTVLDDITGNGNNATIATGANAPTWTSTGLAFQPGEGVPLPASLNGSMTYFVAVYLNPLTAGAQTTNIYPVLLSSSAGADGFNLLTVLDAPPNDYTAYTYAPSLYVNSQHMTSAPNLISGFHVLAVVLGTGSNDLDHIYIDGVEVASYIHQGASAGAQSSGDLYLGSSGVSPWQSSGLNGTMYRLRVYPTQLTASQVQGVSASIRNEVSSRGVPVSPVDIPQGTPQFHAIGDSITFGQGVSTPWPSLLQLNNQPNYTIDNWGISGIALEAINASEPNRAALRCRSSEGPSIAVVFAGTNDFQLTKGTPTDIFTYLMGEVQTMKQAGCRVFVGTMISRGGAGYSGATFDASKDAYDALILSQAKAAGADGVIDFAANPLLGADGANTGSYFQGDHIHPTQDGQALLAAEASNVLNYAFGYNEANPHVVTTLNYAMTAADGYVSLSGLTGAGTLTLPDCTGQSGAIYRINNPQSAFAVTVAPLNGSQSINGLSSVTVPANATISLRDVPNPKTVAGCHWEM